MSNPSPDVMAGGRSWAQPMSTAFTVVHRWANPALISDAPALVKIPPRDKGAPDRLLCALELWSRDSTAARLYGRDCALIFASDDAGLTWRETARLPFSTGKFLATQGVVAARRAAEPSEGSRVWFIGSGTGWEGLWVTASDDGGETWTEPACVVPGRIYAASTGWTVVGDTLVWAADDMAPSARERQVFALCARLDGDLADPKSWRTSNRITHPGVPQSLGRGPHNGGKWLEPNVVGAPRGRWVDGWLLVIVRVRVSQGDVDGVVPNLGAICDLVIDGGQPTLRTREFAFSHYYPFPGGQNHFYIIHDDEAKLFWMTSNSITGRATRCYRGWGKERRFLMLHYSLDAQHWFPAGCLAMWPGESQAFNYCTPLIDGDDLLFVSRTARRAPNQHDNDCVTFHRVPAFRSRALDLCPSTNLAAVKTPTPDLEHHADG